MAFSDDTRNELARVVPAARCCRVAELSAFYDLDGMLMGNAKQYLDFTTSALLWPEGTDSASSLYPEISTQILVRRSRSATQICTVRVLQTKEAQAVYGEMKEQRYTAKGEYLQSAAAGPTCGGLSRSRFHY